MREKQRLRERYAVLCRPTLSLLLTPTSVVENELVKRDVEAQD